MHTVGKTKNHHKHRNRCDRTLINLPLGGVQEVQGAQHLQIEGHELVVLLNPRFCSGIEPPTQFCCHIWTQAVDVYAGCPHLQRSFGKMQPNDFTLALGCAFAAIQFPPQVYASNTRIINLRVGRPAEVGCPTVPFPLAKVNPRTSTKQNHIYVPFLRCPYQTKSLQCSQRQADEMAV